jgi:NAD(P)-dependent dehydrogenase (short-subunit alcohol dehydrogenase family)
MDADTQVVVVTGAAGNLGRAVAEAFRARGTALGLVDLDADALARAHGPDTPRQAAFAADLTGAEAAAEAIAGVRARFGRIDALCNIAGGFAMGHPVHATPDELWRRMLDLNVATMVNAVRAAVPAMLAAGRGRIVNVGAASAQSGKAEMGAYVAAKSAVIRLTESMAAELRERGINVNCVLPTIIDTPENRRAMPKADPAKWVAPAALADVIAFLASDAARAVHGAAIPVSGLS